MCGLHLAGSTLDIMDAPSGSTKAENVYVIITTLSTMWLGICNVLGSGYFIPH